MLSTTAGTLNPVRDGLPRLRLLGAVELEGPVILRFLPERRFRLLSYLALQGAWVARDQLAHRNFANACSMKALRQAARLENLPTLLITVHCYAERQVHAGDVRDAVALWLFIIAHPQTTLSGGVPSGWQTARRYPMKTTHGPYSRRSATI